jgi:4-hydroxybenzoate polyprenyltransferase
VAVTLFAAGLAALAGASAALSVLVAVAVLSGQLSIGWSNDRIDTANDRAAGRLDKPAAAGQLAPAVLERAIGASVVATVALSAALGWRAWLVHLIAVGCGWIYNVVAKRTVLSWLPYAVAFGALPSVAYLSVPPRTHWAPWWLTVAAALLGVVAHFTNVLPDLAADAQAGIRGAPHRMGFRASLILSAALLLAATAVIALGPPGPTSVAGWIGLGIAVLLVAGGLPWALARSHQPASPAIFYGVVAFVAIQLVLIVDTIR